VPTVDELTPLSNGTKIAFACGSARFVGLAEVVLVDGDVAPGAIRFERIGPLTESGRQHAAAGRRTTKDGHLAVFQDAIAQPCGCVGR
jgi:hypothetical protein